MDATWFPKKYSNTALKTNNDKLKGRVFLAGKATGKKKNHKKAFLT